MKNFAKKLALAGNTPGAALLLCSPAAWPRWAWAHAAAAKRSAEATSPSPSGRGVTHAHSRS